jgi:hypothetical protein
VKSRESVKSVDCCLRVGHGEVTALMNSLPVRTSHRESPMRSTPLIVVLLAICVSRPAPGQNAPAPFATVEFSAFEPPAAGSPARPTRAEDGDHTLTGFLIGAALGLAMGWVMYDTLCEAVDNQCTPGPAGLLIFGGAIGGSFGALIGSLSD